MAGSERGGRKFAPLPPGIVRVRMEGQSASRLLALLTALPGMAVVTGPDAYPGGRLYLTVAVLDEGQGAGRPLALPGGGVSAELSARITAAKAALADYRRNEDMDMVGRALWAERLSAELGGLLDELGRTGAQGGASQ